MFPRLPCMLLLTLCAGGCDRLRPQATPTPSAPLAVVCPVRLHGACTLETLSESLAAALARATKHSADVELWTSTATKPATRIAVVPAYRSVHRASARLLQQEQDQWLVDKTADLVLRVRPIFAEVLSKPERGWWAEDDRRSRHRDRNYEDEQAILERIERFVLHAPPRSVDEVLAPLVSSVGLHPQDVARFVEGLIYRQDGVEDSKRFWEIWEQFANELCSASWLARLDEHNSQGDALIRAIFLGIMWRDGLEIWHGLVGNEKRTQSFFERLPPSRLVFTCYVRMLYNAGGTALPDAFVVLADRLRLGTPVQLLGDSNCVYMLECLLRRWVYGRPSEIKRSQAARDAVVALLDSLVEVGSSAAFQMRDDFVTPLAAC